MSKYKIKESYGHGKACKGKKLTATFQVIEPFPKGYFVRKQFQFTEGDPKSKTEARKKAEKWLKENEINNT